MFPSWKSVDRLKTMEIEVEKDTAIKVRLVKVPLDTGEIEILATSLYDTSFYSAEDLKEAYHLRWGIETFYGHLKEELQLAQFSGTRKICIEQDFAANMFLFNLQSLIEKQCKPHVDKINQRRGHNYKVNKNVSWAWLKYRVIDLFLTKNDITEVLLELQNLFEKNLEPVRPGRKFPRIEKRKPDCKNYTLTNYKRAI